MEKMDSRKNKRSFDQCFWGEWFKTKYYAWVMGAICMVAAFIHNDNAQAILEAPLFQTALLFIAIGYLSELRYTLLPESRND